GAQTLGELDGVVIGPEMHEEQPRLLIQHVAVQRRHLDAVRPQRLDYGIDLIAGENEVASDGGFAAAGRLEVDRDRNPHGTDRRELHAAFADGIASRYVEGVNAAIVLTLDADDLVELSRVEIDRRRGTRRDSDRQWGLALGKRTADR